MENLHKCNNVDRGHKSVEGYLGNYIVSALNGSGNVIKTEAYIQNIHSPARVCWAILEFSGGEH